jgi:hypothetical protein
VTVLGSSGAGGGAEAVPGTTLAEALKGSDLRAHAVDGARYVATGADTSSTFSHMAASVAADSSVVVLLGGRNDRSDSLFALSTAATGALQAIKRQAPGAKIVVVGPVWPSRSTPPSSLLTVRSILHAAAKTEAVGWVDPIDSGWLQDKSGMVTSTAALTAAGRAELARRLAQVIDPLTPD